MNLWSVEHFFNIFFSSKLDSPVIKALERIRFSSNQNIGEGESNFDEMLKKCSTDQRFIQKKNTTYKIGTLDRRLRDTIKSPHLKFLKLLPFYSCNHGPFINYYQLRQVRASLPGLLALFMLIRGLRFTKSFTRWVETWEHPFPLTIWCSNFISKPSYPLLNPNWHEAGRIYPPYNFWIGFQIFLEVKIEINQDNLTPCEAHRVL